MPKPIKKRVTKKTVFKEPEVKNVAMRALDFIKERKKQLIITVSALCIIAVLYIAFMFYTSSLNKKAYSLEMDAYNYYYGVNLPGGLKLTTEERWKKALELYKKSLEVKVTPTALFYLGNCYYNLGDYDNAIKEYNVFIDKFRNEKEILPLVYQKLASAYFKNNRNDKAIETLDALARLENGIFKDTALILEARYYETAGEFKKALEKYKELVNEFPVSPWSAEAQAKIASQDTKR
jgi:tetratricopeptide (TPR) repeat protein